MRSPTMHDRETFRHVYGEQYCPPMRERVRGPIVAP